MDAKLWNDIRLIVSDFDGVMTDNRVWVDETGKETVCVNRADGQAVHMLRDMGINLVIMSTEKNEVVAKRADKLNIECIQSISDKAECLKKYCEDQKICQQNVIYIGNDINDLGALQLAGIRIVPGDAYEEVRAIADYVTEAMGGQGVIREVAGILKKLKYDKGIKNGKERDKTR